MLRNNKITKMNKPNFSNLTDRDLRFLITKKEEQLEQIESKLEKTTEELEKLGKVKEEFNLLLQQSHIPFRLTNTIWFNRLNSIFFSIKNNTNNQTI